MTERFTCSGASTDRAEAVVATASQVRAWLLIEVHGAWGIDAIEDSHLGVHTPVGWKADLKLRGIRPVCIRSPLHAPEPEHPRLFFVIAARPGRTEGVVWTRTVPTLAAVQYVTRGLRLDRAPAGWERHDERVVIVCTNGKHDQCCAIHGRPVLRHLRDSPWCSQVWECSHIGGDRFAANVVVLPDSLYFGRMAPEEAEAILDAHAEGRIELDWYRGRSSHRFAEQAAEHAIRAAFDVRGVDDVVIDRASPRDRVRAAVAGIGTVDAVVERTVVHLDEPLTCRGSAPQQVPTYAVTELVEVADRVDGGPNQVDIASANDGSSSSPTHAT